MPRIPVLLITLFVAAVVQAGVAVSEVTAGDEASLANVTCSQAAVNPTNGHTYEFIRLSTAVSWHDALSMAENAGGYLATITDASEAAIVTSLLSNPGDEAWLGASDEAQEGTWVWANGEPWGYTNWYPGEPNDGHVGEDYLLAMNGLGGRWVDVWDNNYGLVIERESASGNVIINPENGHRYEFVATTEAISWHEAVAMAEAAGGYLATITDSTEAAIVTTFMSRFGGETWLGASDEDEEGVWKWITGEPWDYTNWYPGEPNAAYPTQDYLLAQHILGGRWVDVEDDNYGLIIETGGTYPNQNIIVNPENGHTYEYVKLPGDVTWHEAVIMAQNAGGYLATITDSTEAAIVTTLLSMPGHAATWLGGSDEAQEGVWTWVTGEPWGYTNWYPGEPNAAYPNQDYLEAQHVLGGRWVDVEDGCDGIIIEKGDILPGNVIINPENGHRYEFVATTEAISWHEAVAMAEAAGGYLATITDATEAAIVTDFLSRLGSETWLGGSDEEEEGVWKWVTGESWDYTNWYPGEPNAAYPNQDYLLAQRILGGRWVDVEDNNYGLIIETGTPNVAGPSLTFPVGDDLTIYEMLPEFIWSDVTGDVRYKLELATDPAFSSVMVISDLVAAEYQLADSLEFGTHYWWRVTATGSQGDLGVSEIADFWTWTLGDVNESHTITLLDVMMIVDYLYISRTPIEPPEAADMNGDCEVTLLDVMWLVAKLFITQIELRAGCQ